MRKKIFEGTCTALVTPFLQNGKIDFESTKKLLDYQIQNKVDAILILGSTGESFALSKDERTQFIEFVRCCLPKEIKLIVGAGSNNTDEAATLINEAKNLGADCCLIPTPFFCKCSQTGIVQHFEKICSKTNFPIIIYNIPSRSGVNILPQTMLKLCENENIVGLKEANGNIEHVLNMAHTIKDKLAFYCGNDNLYQLFLNLNCDGVISVTSNALPNEIVKMWKEKNKSLSVHDKLFEFNNLMFCEPNPIPVKYALSKLGLIKNQLRLPLTKLDKVYQKQIDQQLKIIGAIK